MLDVYLCQTVYKVVVYISALERLMFKIIVYVFKDIKDNYVNLKQDLYGMPTRYSSV